MKEHTKIQKGETYRVEDGLEVKVLDINKNIESVSLNGVQEVITIKYTTETDDSIYTDHSVGVCTIDEFIKKMDAHLVASDEIAQSESSRNISDRDDDFDINKEAIISFIRDVESTVETLDDAYRVLERLKSKKDKDNNDNQTANN